MKNLKLLIYDLLPPLIIKVLKKKKYGWFGNYSSWDEALQNSTGYDKIEILNRVKESILKVKNGEAVFERDSVLFYKEDYDWPFLGCLLWIASVHQNKLKLIDFGGSLGSVYFQCKKFLSHLEILDWNVVEQKHFVDVGKNLFEDHHLKFYYDIAECIGDKDKKPLVLVLSSVLQYLQDPYLMIQQFINYGFDYIIIDKTGLSNLSKDIITIQKVPEFIYSASYPCWLFSKEKLLSYFSSKYEIIVNFDGGFQINSDTKYEGILLKKII